MKFVGRRFDRPALKLLLDAQFAPELPQRLSELLSVGPVLQQRELSGQVLKRRNDFPAQWLQIVCQAVIIGDLKWPLPHGTFPAPGERLVFEPVEPGFLDGHQAAFERGKKIFVFPVEGGDAQGAARQFGQRVMRDGFAAVEKERDVVAGEDALQNFVIAFERAEDHGGVAETSAVADEAQDLARGERGLGIGVGAGGGAEVGRDA